MLTESDTTHFRRMCGGLRVCQSHAHTYREETFEFPITDENDTACSAIFYMDEEGSQKQIGDEQTYILNLLKKGKPIFKGMHPEANVHSTCMWHTRQIHMSSKCADIDSECVSCTNCQPHGHSCAQSLCCVQA